MKKIIYTSLIVSALCMPLSAQEQVGIPQTFGIYSNILGLATLNPTLDIEYRIYGTFTMGLTAWWEVRKVEDRWGQVEFTYYFGDYAMKGFGLSLTGGVYRAYRGEDDSDDVKSSDTAGTAGMLASYAWRFGPSEMVFLAPAIGFKKTFAGEYDDSPLKSWYAEASLNAGIVF